MAVAADFHRDFLIPEYIVKQYTRQRADAQMSRVILWCICILQQKTNKVNRLFKLDSFFCHVGLRLKALLIFLRGPTEARLKDF